MSFKKGGVIKNIAEFRGFIKSCKDLSGLVVMDIDFKNQNLNWNELSFKNTTFLGCKFKKKDAYFVISKGAFVFPKFEGLPYNPYRQNLYTWQELMDGFDPKNDCSNDFKIYKHFVKNKRSHDVNEALAQRIHDHNIDNGLRELLDIDENGIPAKKVVGFMGGHSEKRGSVFYNKVALSAKWLTEKGYFIASGGGPGIMEAANLGAYFGGKQDEDLSKAIKTLSDLDKVNPADKDFEAKNYITQSKKVLDSYTGPVESLAIPTWFYGHEPSNLFATHIAKYFSNSIREDMLLAVSIHGVVYAPGSAGTTQEIFQDAAQNHYATFGYFSPMVFLSKERYVKETSIYKLLEQLSKGQKYRDLLFLTDSPEEVVGFIQKNKPIKSN